MFLISTILTAQYAIRNIKNTENTAQAINIISPTSPQFIKSKVLLIKEMKSPAIDSVLEKGEVVGFIIKLYHNYLYLIVSNFFPTSKSAFSSKCADIN